jgi:predicted transcriptional regulator
MTDPTPIQGELQARIMTALWSLEEGTVEQVRRKLPARHRGAYNTVQTVLNRLAERGLLSRRREKNAIVYRPRLSEGQYLSRTIERTLSGASADARQVALAQLLGDLEEGELTDLQQLARTIDETRRRRR